MTTIKREQILAFRLERAHLFQPLPLSSLVEAAEAGIQLSQPGTLETALGIRVKGFTTEALETALRKKKTLVEVPGIRGAGHVVPKDDVGLFTRATFPTDEKNLQRLLGTPSKNLRAKKIPASTIIQTVTDAAMKALDGKALTQDEIHAEWRKRLPKEYLNFCRGCDSFHVPYTTVAAVGLQGTVFCYGPIKDGNSAFVRTDQWLGKNAVETDLEKLRIDLVKRFLRYYGPSTPKAFSVWSDLSVAEAKEFFTIAADELTQVETDAGPAWLNKKDLPLIQSAQLKKGILMLAAKDPILNMPDREILAEDKKVYPLIWRVLANPGVFLIDGELAGIWKALKKGKRLEYTIQAFGKLPKQTQAKIEEEASRIAAFRDCTETKTRWGKC